jgi:predicted nucleotidyltransferase
MRSQGSARPPQLVEVLFGAYRRGVLGLLLMHPDESFYVREIGRMTGIPAGSLHRELKLLTDGGLLTRTMNGNQVRFQANRTCPVFEDLAALFRKTSGLADVLREALLPIAGRVHLAFVFGSVAQGTERAASDVDIMVVGSASFEEVVEALSDSQTRLQRQVNPVVMTRAGFRAKLEAHDRFITRIVREPKVMLMGDASDFGEPAEDRPD